MSDEPQKSYQSDTTPQSQGTQPAAAKKVSGMAIAGLVLGVIGVIFSFIPIINNAAFVLGILGLIFGIVGIRASRADGPKSGRGLSIAAVVLCVLAMVITLVMQQAASNAIDEATSSVSASLSSETSDTSASDTSDSSDSSNTSDSSDTSSASDSTLDTEGDLGDYHLKIVSATSAGADYNGKDTVMVTYEWTNNSDEATSFAGAFMPYVYQNGVSLDVAIYTQSPAGYDPQSELSQVQPGSSSTVTVAYTLDDSSPVQVEVEGLALYHGPKVTHTFQLS